MWFLLKSGLLQTSFFILSFFFLGNLKSMLLCLVYIAVIFSKVVSLYVVRVKKPKRMWNWIYQCVD